MKIKSVTLQNFANYDNVNVSFDENITYLVGKNGSGKSTLGITAVWFILQGIAEKAMGGNNPLIGERFRFIGLNAATAKGSMVLVDEEKGIEIQVLRKLTKTGTELSFVAPEGYELDQKWLNDLFNIFLIAPKRFIELSSKEQAVALGIETSYYDTGITALKSEYTSLNRELKAFGIIIEVEKVDRVDVSDLKAQKEDIRIALNKQYHQNKAENARMKQEYESQVSAARMGVDDFNDAQDLVKEKIDDVKHHLDCLIALGYKGKEVDEFLFNLDRPEPKLVYGEGDKWPGEPTYNDEMPDDSEMQAIDQKIVDATATNEKAFAYEQYLIKVEKRDAKQKELDDNKQEQTDKEAERLKYIKGFKLPFKNMAIGENGELLFNSRPLKEPYFSTGELLKYIPIIISTRNPKLKYVFLQDFNLLDEDVQQEVEKYLVGKGFQLVVELVGKSKLADKNCILLKDNVVVEDYAPKSEEELL